MAKKKRGFTPTGVPEKQDDYHGGCRVVRISPDIASKGVQSVNINLTFEEALRLSTAVQSAVLKLNRYNRATKAGQEIGLCLSLKTDISAIAVIETKIRLPKSADASDQANSRATIF
jgi:hypothetical protein